jgi:hypothetical protein
MPRISEFFGVAIYMYYNDHRPAHFHAEYGEREALFVIDTLEILEGDLPRRPHAFVIEWASLHRRNFAPIGREHVKDCPSFLSNHWTEYQE